MKTGLIIVCLFALFHAITGHAQTLEELKQQLETQKQINELLKQRIRKLEALLEIEENSAKVSPSTPAAILEPVPDKQAIDVEETRALERALVRKGHSILPSGRWELTPGLAWAHSGSDAIRTRSDDYLATLEARVGLASGTMFGIGFPYFIKADRAAGDNSGFGDLSVRLWKQFLVEGETTPALIGSIAYNAITGEDANGRVPLGSNSHRLSVNLNSSKSIDPLVLYGDLFYTYSFSERFNGIDYKPGNSVGIRGGSSLAITPAITGSIGLNVSFIDEFEREGVTLNGTKQTVGFLEVGLGYVISKRYFLSISGDIGITDDAPDFALDITLPIRL